MATRTTQYKPFRKVRTRIEIEFRRRGVPDSVATKFLNLSTLGKRAAKGDPFTVGAVKEGHRWVAPRATEARIVNEGKRIANLLASGHTVQLTKLCSQLGVSPITLKRRGIGVDMQGTYYITQPDYDRYASMGTAAVLELPADRVKRFSARRPARDSSVGRPATGQSAAPKPKSVIWVRESALPKITGAESYDFYRNMVVKHQTKHGTLPPWARPHATDPQRLLFDQRFLYGDARNRIKRRYVSPSEIMRDLHATQETVSKWKRVGILPTEEVALPSGNKQLRVLRSRYVAMRSQLRARLQTPQVVAFKQGRGHKISRTVLQRAEAESQRVAAARRDRLAARKREQRRPRVEAAARAREAAKPMRRRLVERLGMTWFDSYNRISPKNLRAMLERKKGTPERASERQRRLLSEKQAVVAEFDAPWRSSYTKYSVGRIRTLLLDRARTANRRHMQVYDRHHPVSVAVVERNLAKLQMMTQQAKLRGPESFVRLANNAILLDLPAADKIDALTQVKAALAREHAGARAKLPYNGNKPRSPKTVAADLRYVQGRIDEMKSRA